MHALEDLDAIGGIGETVAQEIVEFFREPQNREVVKRLMAAVRTVPLEQVKADSPCRARPWCSRTLMKMTRNEAKARAESLGAKVAGLRLGEDGSRRRGARRGLEAQAGASARRPRGGRGRLARADRQAVRGLSSSARTLCAFRDPSSGRNRKRPGTHARDSRRSPVAP